MIQSYQIEVMWNREFNFSKFSNPTKEIKVAKDIAESAMNSGDGASIKKYRIVNSEGEVVYPPQKPTEQQNYPKVYTCNFCSKQEVGKNYGWLIKPIRNKDYDLSLRPYGWDFMYVNPCKNSDVLWSCGCYRFN